MRLTEKGFTLIELIVVIALVGLLMAIGLPDFLVWRSRAVYREAAETVAAKLRETRMLSHSGNRQYRMEFDLANRRYRIIQGNRAQNSSTFDPADDGVSIVQEWTNINPIITLRRDADCSATSNFSLGFNANGTAITSYNDGATASDYLCILNEASQGYRVGVSSVITGRTVVDRYP